MKRAFQKVEVCGVLTRSKRTKKKITFVVDDGTGSIECSKILSFSSCGSADDIYDLGNTLVVRGEVRSLHSEFLPSMPFSEQRKEPVYLAIWVTHVELVEDPNYELMHMERCISLHTTLYCRPFAYALSGIPFDPIQQSEPLTHTYEFVDGPDTNYFSKRLLEHCPCGTPSDIKMSLFYCRCTSRSVGPSDDPDPEHELTYTLLMHLLTARAQSTTEVNLIHESILELQLPVFDGYDTKLRRITEEYIVHKGMSTDSLKLLTKMLELLTRVGVLIKSTCSVGNSFSLASKVDLFEPMYLLSRCEDKHDYARTVSKVYKSIPVWRCEYAFEVLKYEHDAMQKVI